MSAICVKCKSGIDEYEVFPGPKCLNCHDEDFVMPTEKELVAMWRGQK